jgi:hypothetical protein
VPPHQPLFGWDWHRKPPRHIISGLRPFGGREIEISHGEGPVQKNFSIANVHLEAAYGISRLPEIAGDKPAKKPFKRYPIAIPHRYRRGTH